MSSLPSYVTKSRKLVIYIKVIAIAVNRRQSYFATGCCMSTEVLITAESLQLRCELYGSVCSAVISTKVRHNTRRRGAVSRRMDVVSSWWEGCARQPRGQTQARAAVCRPDIARWSRTPVHPPSSSTSRASASSRLSYFFFFYLSAQQTLNTSYDHEVKLVNVIQLCR